MAAEVTTLVAGISDAVVLSVFSSDIVGSFVVARTVPATAVLFTEPAIAATSRQSSNTTSNNHRVCPRPIVNLGQKIKTAKQKLSPFLDRISKIVDLISSIQTKLSSVKMK